MPVKRVLAVSLTALGDTLVSLPALDALRAGLPEAEIAFLVRPPFHELYEGHRSIDKVFAVHTPEGKDIKGLNNAWKLYKTIKAFSPDVTLIFLGTPDYVVPILRLSGVRKIYSVPNRGRFRYLLTNSELRREHDWNVREHAAEDRLRAVRLLGIEAKLEPLRLQIQEGWIEESTGWLMKKGWQGEKIMVFQVCSSNFRRAWPKDRFARLARELLAVLPEAICIITGTQGERTYCESIKEMANVPGVWVSAGELTISGVAGLLSQTSLLVTPDTGIMHLGHALKTPSVSLYGLYDLHRTIALDKSYPHIEIQRFPPDHPNSRPEDRLNSGMQFIPFQDVFNASLQILETKHC